ncbi:MAG: hypothetical protein LBV68_05795 [Spirochaetaceae bacterium]|jgi:hypothetical protein|nr:hypothetical protein [Spirochaetaceae bacterium]
MITQNFKRNAPFLSTIIYTVVALLCLVLFRLVYPDLPHEAELLPIFRLNAKFAKAFLSCIEFFPAIFLSALLIPFLNRQDEHQGSAAYFNLMNRALLCCFAGTLIFASLSLIAKPSLLAYQHQLYEQSKIYNTATIKAAGYIEKDQWREADQILRIGEKIWKDNQSIRELRLKVEIALDKLRYAREGNGENAKALSGTSGQRTALNAEEALEFAKQALREKRYYDANWFSHLAISVSVLESAVYKQAMNTASASWNAIASLEPDIQEERTYSRYREKRDGYEALVSGDFFRAYSIFKALVTKLPQDPDIQKYFKISEKALESIAFFFDEADLALGNEQSNVLFSLPADNSIEGGRFVLRISGLTVFEDKAFGRNMELLAFDRENRPVFRLNTELVKIIPAYDGSTWKTQSLIYAVDRNNPALKKEPHWTMYRQDIVKHASIPLNLSYEDFMRAAAAQRSGEYFSVEELWKTAQLDSLGFIPQLFYANILDSFYFPLLFLPLSIFTLIIGLKYCPKIKQSHTNVLMFFIFPLVIEFFLLIIERIVSLITMWAALSYSFIFACLICAASSLILFLFSLFLFAAQYGKKEA